MTVKAAKRTCIVVMVATGLGLGEGAPPSAGRAGSAPEQLPPARPAFDSVVDLDFSEDIPADPGTGPAPGDGNPGGQVTRILPDSDDVADPRSARAWVYWAAGAAAMAAGGAAWYFHWEARPAPGPVRDDQVFTDAAD